MEQVTVEKRQQLLVDGFVKFGNLGKNLLLKSKFDWVFMFFYFDDWSIKLKGFDNDCKKIRSFYLHKIYSYDSYPNSDLTSNYCRNPDGEPQGPWCYTKMGWEHCGIPKCSVGGKFKLYQDLENECAMRME